MEVTVRSTGNGKGKLVMEIGQPRPGVQSVALSAFIDAVLKGVKKVELSATADAVVLSVEE